ncbi:hypothetical protein PR048_005250 [Dryococelus australis]|uniref:Uncharacterized protein n=1 Tax=Dryococelus australis TaxID=614101 RepID=A0ABQ9I7N3_9NEOP|nr:hypothetical protein PR048_005250 [Dryococelus australis]
MKNLLQETYGENIIIGNVSGIVNVTFRETAESILQDGKKYFHGLGIIACITPKLQKRSEPVPRRDVSLEDVRKVDGIPFHYFQESQNKKFMFDSLSSPTVSEQIITTNMLRYISWFFHEIHPTWSVKMQDIYTGNKYSGRAEIVFIPMIGHNTSDPSCIYSTLLFICSEASRCRKKAIVTFHQPLYWKSEIIINSEPTDSALKSFILLLGGFRLRMSFISSIVTIMEALDCLKFIKLLNLRLWGNCPVKMAGNFSDMFSFTKADQVITMTCRKSIHTKNGYFRMEHSQLFQILIVVALKGGMNLKNVMTHELCSIPLALFEDCDILRLENKATLSHALWSIGKPSADIPCLQDCKYVIDDGWPLNNTLRYDFDSYISYVKTRFKIAIIVFDGYNGSPCIKDCTHLRQTNGLCFSDVHLSPETKLSMNKDLSAAQCKVLYANSDADICITRTSIEESKIENVRVVGNCTDLLILLFSFSLPHSTSLYFKTETKLSDIKSSKASLGELSKSLLFVHSFFCCNTTSRFFGFGKQTAFYLTKSDATFKKAAMIFNTENLVYKDHKNESVLVLRVRVFEHKVCISTDVVGPETLPPTPSAVKYLSLRAYPQIVEWKGYSRLMRAKNCGNSGLPCTSL